MKKSLWGATSLSTVLLLLPAVLAAQSYHKLDTPVDSPLWWTLTDTITPAELKRQHTDRALTLKRYDKAVVAGAEAPLPEAGTQRSRDGLVFYINSGLTPQLVPMWVAFRRFGFFVLDDEIPADAPDVQEGLRALQGEYGVSSAGVATITNTRRAAEAEVENFIAVRERDLKRAELDFLLMEVYGDPKRAASAPPEGKIEDALAQGDYQTIASAVGRPVSEIREAVDGYADWDASYALIANTLPVLKGQLSASDWQGIRRFLLRYVVQNNSGSTKFFVNYYEGAGR